MVVDVLRDLLVDDLFVEISEKDGRSFVRLRESGRDAKLKRVDIYDIPKGSLLLKLDKYEQPKTLFKGTHGERQRCDYVLVTTVRKNPVLLFIEMKSRHVKDSQVRKQFIGAECIFDYCDAVLNRFHGKDGLVSQCRKYFVVFYKPSIAKRTTRPALPRKNNDSPDRPLKYPSPQNPSLKALVAL